MRDPSFWWRDRTMAARLLAPAGAVYGAVAQLRLQRRGHRAAAPVICIGNLTVGGAGKTPLALATADMLKTAGEHPVFLTRGYGGTFTGPVQVDAASHTAAEVGDEALLLARAAPTVVARDRVAGAAIAAQHGVIVMDDGFQNPALRKDVSVLVVDERRGLGNGQVFPAGPLRAPLAAQMARAQAVILVGAPSRGAGVSQEARKRDLPLFRAHLRADQDFVAALGAPRVLAFAGIADPQKFFATLSSMGVIIARTRAFPDHHRYTRAEARALCEDAERECLVLVTTEKDLARLRGDDEAAGLAQQARALPVTLTFEEAGAFRSFLLERLAVTRKELLWIRQK
jgi:tetraacyldisaccharide 4'-kinase